MMRGTTPTHTFHLPFDTSLVRSVRVIYLQRQLGNALRLTKETDACALDGAAIRVTLTQEDTLLFDSRLPVEIQLRVLTHTGQALSSKPIAVDVGECLDGEVLE